VNVMVPKSAKGTRLLPDSKSWSFWLANIQSCCVTSTNLDDPLSVGLTEAAKAGLVAEGVGHAVPGRQVLDRGGTCGLAGSYDGGLDRVTGRHVEVVESVAVVRVPLIPSLVGGLGAFDQKLNTGLQDSWVAPLGMAFIAKLVLTYRSGRCRHRSQPRQRLRIRCCCFHQTAPRRSVR
jgi:hypothetical protein